MIDGVPELWMEIYHIVQEAVDKTIPEKKKCKKAEWLCEEALQRAEKRRKAPTPPTPLRHTGTGWE